MSQAKSLDSKYQNGLLDFLYQFKYEILIIVFLFFYLFPILGSGYYGDDVVISGAPGKYIHHPATNTSFDYAFTVTKSLLRQGRFTPFGVSYYVLQDFFNNFSNPILANKLFLNITTIFSVFCAGLFVGKATGSKKLKLITMLIMPVFFEMTKDTYNGLNQFTGLIQFVVSACFLSLTFLLYHFERKRMIYKVMSLVFMTITLLLYELGIIVVIPTIILLIVNSSDFKDWVRKAMPYLVVLMAYAVLTLIVRNIASAELRYYDGIETDLSDVSVVGTAFAAQFTGGIPLTEAIFSGTINGFSFADTNIFEMIAICLYVALVCLIVFKEKGKEKAYGKKDVIAVLLTGLSMWVVAAGLVAVTPKYQNYVMFGTSYLPVYVEYFGMALMIIACVMGLLNLNRKIVWRIIAIVLLALGTPVLLINMNLTNRFFDNGKLEIYSPRKLMADSAHAGLYDDYVGANPENLLVAYTWNNLAFGKLTTRDALTTYAKRPIYGITMEEFIAEIGGDLSQIAEYDAQTEGTEQVDVTRMMNVEENGGVVLYGRMEWFRYEPDVRMTCLADNVMLYVKSENPDQEYLLKYVVYDDNMNTEEKSMVVSKTSPGVLEVMNDGGYLFEVLEEGLIDVTYTAIEQL